MKQLFEQMRLVWIVGVMVLVASFMFAKSATSNMNDPTSYAGTQTTQRYTYHGSSPGYTAVPHPWSLTYARPGTDYYMRDRARQRRWEDEDRKEDPPLVPEWARAREITLASQ